MHVLELKLYVNYAHNVYNITMQPMTYSFSITIIKKFTSLLIHLIPSLVLTILLVIELLFQRRFTCLIKNTMQ